MRLKATQAYSIFIPFKINPILFQNQSKEIMTFLRCQKQRNIPSLVTIIKKNSARLKTNVILIVQKLILTQFFDRKTKLISFGSAHKPLYLYYNSLQIVIRCCI